MLSKCITRLRRSPLLIAFQVHLCNGGLESQDGTADFRRKMSLQKQNIVHPESSRSTWPFSSELNVDFLTSLNFAHHFKKTLSRRHNVGIFILLTFLLIVYILLRNSAGFSVSSYLLSFAELTSILDTDFNTESCTVVLLRLWSEHKESLRCKSRAAAEFREHMWISPFSFFSFFL